MNNPAKITAQVAVEAIADNPNAFDVETVRTVLEFAIQHEVSQMYTDLIVDRAYGQQV